jgi:hypothetical protein
MAAGVTSTPILISRTYMQMIALVIEPGLAIALHCSLFEDLHI